MGKGRGLNRSGVTLVQSVFGTSSSLPFLKSKVTLTAMLLLAAIGGRSAAQAEENAQCKLFTQNEASAYVGASVGTAKSGFQPGISGCSWSDEGTGNKMSVDVLPAGNALQLPQWGVEGWDGFRAVPGIGAKAYVARTPTLNVMGRTIGGDWQAGAIVGSDYVVVGIRGPKGNADAAVALLKDTIKRRQ